MKPVLLIVEDNKDVLYNLKLTLEFNGYEAITAEDGLDAIQILSKLSEPPDLIISDIMMPKMDGYDFFKTVSENPSWSAIPFIFLTARTSPKDIRFGKMLGVDDYIIKPFKEEDLLASIAGKIARNKKTSSINKKIEALFTSLKIDTTPSISSYEKAFVILLYVLWHDKNGPTLISHYPIETQLPISAQNLGFQLFNGASSIYGQAKIHEAHGILLNIQNIHRHGYIYFDAIQDNTARGNERPFMVGVVTPNISYFDSMKVKEIFEELSVIIKKGESWDIEAYWERISNILSTPVL